MKKIVLTMSLITCLIIGKGQDNSNSTLYIVKYGSKEIRTYHLLLSLYDFDDLQEVSRTEAVNIYGAKNGLVVIVTPMSDLKLLTLPMLFDKYGINKANRGHPVYINGKLTAAPDDIIAADNYVNTITANKDSINIITYKHFKYRHTPKNSKQLKITKLESNP